MMGGAQCGQRPLRGYILESIKRDETLSLSPSLSLSLSLPLGGSAKGSGAAAALVSALWGVRRRAPPIARIIVT